MYMYHMTDILPLLGIPGPKNPDMRSFYISCPCCDTGKSTHMNINLRKDVFRCVVCDFSGGVLDLYAYYKNIPRSEAYCSLMREVGAETQGGYESRWHQQPNEAEEDCPPTDIRYRHQTYTALLKRLSLAEDHRLNLKSRGLTDTVIDGNQYRTTPVMGHRMIARQLQEAGVPLRGVPGFFKTKDGEWCLVRSGRGFLIPVRDLQGRIQGLQLRLDQTDKRKYRWLSSTDRLSGTGAKGWVHTAGPVRRSMILTEGGLKAEIIRHFTGQSLLAIPGVNMLSELEKTLRACKQLGLERLMSGFDMDFLRNHHVFDAYEKMIKMIEATGIQYTTYLWDPIYNGLDDYCKHRVEREG